MNDYRTNFKWGRTFQAKNLFGWRLSNSLDKKPMLEVKRQLPFDAAEGQQLRTFILYAVHQRRDRLYD